MLLNAILLEALKAGIPILIEKCGKDFLKRFSPPIKKARKSAVKKMANELGPKFPSINFLELNFRFDSDAIKKELKKLISGREMPDENILKQGMAKEVAEKWPKFLNQATEIVESFLKYFEEECLAFEELKGFAIVSIIRKESTGTNQVVQEEAELTRKEMFEGFQGIYDKLDKLEFSSRSTTQETEIKKITSKLEERLLRERDDLLDSIKKWQSLGLYGRIQKLAEDTAEVYKVINPEISGSIFRLCGSFILRSLEDFDRAKYWIGLADEIEPNNQKTTALKAEILCLENKWDKAKEMLDPIADSSEHPLVKIIYAECLSHFLGISNAFEWFKKIDNSESNSELQLNLAIFAAKKGEDEYALDILKKLKERPHHGPYPYLITAEIFVRQAAPKELISISPLEDMELQKSNELLILAIDNLKTGMELLKIAGRPTREISYAAQKLSEIYLLIDDPTSAEKFLLQHWKTLRKKDAAWFSASSIASLKGNNHKALIRAQKALKVSKKGDNEPLFHFALLCLNIKEWDKCLETMNSIPIDSLDENHIKASHQMRSICYIQKGDADLAEKSIVALKDQFPTDEMWVIQKVSILTKFGKIDDAIALLNKEGNNFQDSIKIKLHLASLYRQQKKYPDALPLYKEIAVSLGSAVAFEGACKVALYSDNSEKALSIISDAEERGIYSENLKHFKAVALTINKQHDEALNLFSTFTEDSLNNDDYIFYACCHANLANREKAIALLNKARVKYPDDERIMHKLYILYLEINEPEKAFEEALTLQKKNPDDKSPYFAVISTGFAIGKQEIAHKAMVDYLSRFGEGPELRTGRLEDLKEVLKISSEKRDFLWKKYQDELLPEVILAEGNTFGIGGHRILLLESPERVMAYDGNPDSQRRQFLDSITGKNILVDYHALITIFRLDLIDPILALFQQINIPETVLLKIREDLIRLSTSYQKDRRYIVEETFSKLKDTIQINKVFPKLNQKEIPESIGNTIYDIMVCKEKHCTFVMAGFEGKEFSDMKALFNIEPISVLDIADLMKEKGIITVKKYDEAIETLKKYNLKRLSGSGHIPISLMFDWNALEMLEECEILNYIDKLASERHIGPFSYAVLRSDIDRYKAIDKIQNTLKDIEDKLSKFKQGGKLNIIACPTAKKNICDDNSEKLPRLEYIEDINNICKEKQFVLWTDDLGFKTLSASDDVKTTCTRTILDLLLTKEIITKEFHVQKIVQILKWNMYFCWINPDLILKCAEMYDYSESNDLMIIIGSITSEIQKYLNQQPNEIERSNFNVASKCIQELWIVSDKAQLLAMKIFDEIYSAVKVKEILSNYWLSKCILDFAFLGIIPLKEFLKMLSLRIVGQVKDELKNNIIIAISACLRIKNRPDELVQWGANKLVVVNIINAVGESIPNYKDELTKLAVQLDPNMQALI